MKYRLGPYRIDCESRVVWREAAIVHLPPKAAKDPRDTQAQLRHADPTVTLKHYQKSIPASVRTAALALEDELMSTSENRFEQVLNRSQFDAELEVIEKYGATRRA